jgi:predicted HTH transcriptional regulator
MNGWNRIESLLARGEGKTLEFKENCRPLRKIVQTVVAFANTAGGALVIGVRDKTKEVVGLPAALAEEEHLAHNTFFGEQPCTETDSEAIDFRAASEFFSEACLEGDVAETGRLAVEPCTRP